MSQENKDQLAPELELKPIEIKEKRDDGDFQEVDLSCKTPEKEIVLQVVVETLRLATNGVFFRYYSPRHFPNNCLGRYTC